MRVGITYDVRDEYLAEGYGEEETAELDRPETIEALERTLVALGYKTDRIGKVSSLVKRLAAGDRWDLVFNIAEGLRGYGREALVPALLEAYDIPYTFSDPLVLAVTLHKGMAKRVVRDLGIPTPDFVIVESESDMDDVTLPYPLFAKPVAEGTGKGITAASKIVSREGLLDAVPKLLRTYGQPVLIETFLPGREFTVGIVGTGGNARAIGVMEVILRDHAEREVYSYVNKEKSEELVEYRLVEDETAVEARKVALAAWRGLGCRDAGRMDLRADVLGAPSFMEVNPLAGLHPGHSDLPILSALAGMDYQQLIDAIMQAAIKRTGVGGNPSP
jgi:D-alanine-D-alanine ligase